MLIYSVLRKVRNCATKQKMWQITSILFRVLTENFYIVPFPCKFRFSFGGKFKFTKETLNYKKTRPLSRIHFDVGTISIKYEPSLRMLCNIKQSKPICIKSYLPSMHDYVKNIKILTDGTFSEEWLTPELRYSMFP